MANENQKYPITTIMQTRLLNLEKTKKVTHERVMQNITSKSIHQYKNIFKTKNTQKNVSAELIHSLARYFGCTVDYIIGESEYLDLDRNGHPMPKTTKIYSEFSDMYYEVTAQLKKSGNFDLLWNLYFLFHDVSPTEAKPIIDSINALITPLRKYSFLNNTHGLTRESLEELKKTLEYIDGTKIDLTLRYSNALTAIENHRYKKALCLLLQIILESEPITKAISSKSIYAIYSLSTKWTHFPIKIKELFPFFEKYLENSFSVLSEDCIYIMREYLEQNINVK